MRKARGVVRLGEIRIKKMGIVGKLLKESQSSMVPSAERCRPRWRVVLVVAHSWLRTILER